MVMTQDQARFSERGDTCGALSFEIGGRRYLIDAPAPTNADELVRGAVSRAERGSAYWAHAWSAGVMLAEYIARSSLVGPGVLTLEIGCGLGLVSIIAASRGGEAVATDISEEALRRVGRSAAMNGVVVETRRLDWNEPAAIEPAPGLILGADVIYDPRDHEPIARLIAMAGCPALLADPARPNSWGFEAALEKHGLRAWQTAVTGGRVLMVRER